MFIHTVGGAAGIEDRFLQDAVYEIDEWPVHHSWFSFPIQPQRCGGCGSMAQHILYRGQWSLCSFVYTSIINIGRYFHPFLCMTCPLSNLLTSSTCAMDVWTLVMFALVGLCSTEALKTHFRMSYTRARPNPHSAIPKIQVLPLQRVTCTLSKARDGFIEIRREHIFTVSQIRRQFHLTCSANWRRNSASYGWHPEKWEPLLNLRLCSFSTEASELELRAGGTACECCTNPGDSQTTNVVGVSLDFPKFTSATVISQVSMTE